jgi:hypothetical protein
MCTTRTRSSKDPPAAAAVLVVLAAVLLLASGVVVSACQVSIESGESMPSATDGAAGTQAQTTLTASTSAATTSSTTPGEPVTLNPQPTHTRPETGTKTTGTTLPPPSPATPLPPGETTTSLMLSPVTADTIPMTWTRYEETDPHIKWTGSWVSYPSPIASGGGLRVASNTAECALVFKGTAARLISVVTPEGGVAQVVLIDDANGATYLHTADFYWPTATTRLLFNTATMPLGVYRLIITWTGTSTSASMGTVIDFDAIEVMGRLVEP